MIKRTLEDALDIALNSFPVVLLNGARQVGKSTLASKKIENYLTFDDIDLRIYAKENPKAFLKNLSLPVCLDEIQKAPNLLEYIKIIVDHDRKNGSFLLTGSSNVLDFKDVKDTLAGRICQLQLYPLSSKEKNGKSYENVIKQILDRDFKSIKKDCYDEVVRHIIDGGYPEILKLDHFAKSLWFKSYISTYIERDARDLGNIRDIDSFIKFVSIIATRSATILNRSIISNEVGIKDITTENYLFIMSRIYQITLLKPYYANIKKQFVKSPKLFFNDTGVLCSLLKINSKEKFLASSYSGAIFETYIFNELQKHIAYLGSDAQIYHYRTNDKKEIDFIIEVEDTILAIEVKQSSSINKSTFKHIIDLQNRYQKDIVGIVFYNGDMVMEFSNNLIALPVSIFL